MQKFIGFYWTLPVPWAGFTDLPKDVDAAAAASRTICYQRDLVRRRVIDEPGMLIGEEVFLELAPDRGSELILPTIERLLKRCRAKDARLALVDFKEALGWRRHGPLWDRLEAERDLVKWLFPDEIIIGGKVFDPVRHFRAWREIEHAHAQAKPERRAEIARALETLATDNPTHATLAKALNGDGIRTPTGRRWTAENLRKFLKSL